MRQRYIPNAWQLGPFLVLVHECEGMFEAEIWQHGQMLEKEQHLTREDAFKDLLRMAAEYGEKWWG